MITKAKVASEIKQGMHRQDMYNVFIFVTSAFRPMILSVRSVFGPRITPGRR